MKKYLLLLNLVIAATATDSFAMMQKIRKMFRFYTTQPTFDHSKLLITKKSAEKLQTISQDCETIGNLITHKSKKISLYKKPSDLIENLLQDKSIHTKYISPDNLFFQDDIQFLNKQFEKLSTKYNSDFAWNNALFLIQTKLDNTYYLHRDQELKHSATLVSLKQEQQLPKMAKALDLFGEYDNPVAFNIENWSQTEKTTMIESIKNHKNILSKE